MTKPVAEARIRVEQLRLLLGNVGSSTIPGILVAILLVWTLSNPSNALALKLWCAAVTVSKLYCTYEARRILASDIPMARGARLFYLLLLLNAIDGAAWGALAWVALDTTTMVGSILVIAVLSGIVGNSMSLLSPVLPVFVVFCVFELGALGLKLWQFGDRAYNGLGIAAMLYLGSLLGQGRNSARATRVAIALRFENIDLVQRLRVETEKARAALQAAQFANLAKSKFLAAASHDLRQPIHAQGLFLEVLARTALSEKQREVLLSARSASEASAGMLHTLLDYSRIEAGVVEPHVRSFHLQPLLRKIENELAPQANAKGIVYRSRETHAAIQSDPALVELILRNLVSNAIRYTARGGVLLACRADGEGVRLEVWDTGMGIAPDQQEEVFREFHQLGNPERDRQKGLGLGLAIAQGLARILGHPLSLASQPGRGSVFKLALPVARAAVLSDALDAEPIDARPFNLRILVIDDDELVREGMRQLLLDWGCGCATAGSIEEALALARADPPNFVISDYRLREQRTGVEAIVALRAACGAALPALLITGDTAPARLSEAHASGVPLLHKPVSPAQLYRRIVGVLRQPAQ